MEQYLEVCKAVTTHGVSGEIKVELWCDSVAFLSRFEHLYKDRQGRQPMRLLKARAHKNMGLITLEGVGDMDAARALVGTVFYIDRREAKLPKGHYFQADLPGCQVVDAKTGTCYGKIREVSQPAAQPIWTVENEAGNTYLFPAVKPFLEGVEVEQGRVLVNPIPGMFGEAEEVSEE